MEAGFSRMNDLTVIQASQVTMALLGLCIAIYTTYHEICNRVLQSMFSKMSRTPKRKVS